MDYLETYKLVLKQLKPELEDKYFVRSIGIFGSLVRRDFLAGTSDIDIIVDFNSAVGIEFIDLANFLELKLQRKVDLVSKNGLRPQYFLQIEPEIIYV